LHVATQSTKTCALIYEPFSLIDLIFWYIIDDVFITAEWAAARKINNALSMYRFKLSLSRNSAL
jgi:hypothetical protein